MDVIAGLIELFGLWLLGNKVACSFIIFILGNIIWIYVAIDKHLYGLLFVSIPAIFINVRNFLKWKNVKS